MDRDFDDYYDMTTDMNELKGQTIVMLTRTDGKHISAHFDFAKTYEKFTVGKHQFTILILAGFHE
jgi:hypothetical protein